MYKLLIVEDEKLLRQGLIHMLPWMEHGFIVIGDASNGEEALRYLETSIPDVIITDIVMPVMNGLELTRIVKDKYPHIQVIILSSHEDFTYVRETLRLGVTDYILKQDIDRETVLKALSKASKALKINAGSVNSDAEQSVETLQTQIFLSLLSNKSPEMSSVHNLMKDSGLTLKEENLRMIIFKPYFSKLDSPNQSGSNIDFLRSALLPYMLPLQDLYAFVTSDNTIVVLFNSSMTEFKSITDLALKAIYNIEISHNISLIALISNLFNGLEHLRSNFNETLKSSEHLFFYPEERVVSYDIFTNKLIKPDLHYKTVHSFIEKLEFSTFYQTVKETLLKLLNQGLYFRVYEVKRDLIELINFTVFHLYEMELELSELKSARFKYIQSLEKANSFADLMEQFKIIMDSIDRYVKDNRIMPMNESILGAIEYIQSNYSSEISLSAVADYLYMNKNYLSELFKEQMGENFSDYLIRVRIERAKEILKDKNIKVSAVGEQVGYPNNSYFIQLFKKIVGMKPSEFARVFRKSS